MNHKAIITHVMNCNICKNMVQQIFSRRAGLITTEAKRKASRLNGLKGGRPKK